MGRKYTTKEFIAQARQKHGNRFNYDKTIYLNSHTKITVTCNLHGDWEVTPDAHKRGNGCPRCKIEKIAKCNRISLENVLINFKTVHKDLYDYSLIKEYNKAHDKLQIICRKHGIFEQSYANHNSGKGCPACAKNGFRPDKPGHLYVLKSGNVIKIGITNREVKDRLKSISRTSGIDFCIYLDLYFENGKVASELEKFAIHHLQEKYSKMNKNFDGYTECFLNVDTYYLLDVINRFLIYYHHNDTEKELQCLILTH